MRLGSGNKHGMQDYSRALFNSSRSYKFDGMNGPALNAWEMLGQFCVHVSRVDHVENNTSVIQARSELVHENSTK